MPVLKSCSEGHVWESEVDQASQLTCPVCGRTEREESTDAGSIADELPPLPREYPVPPVRLEALATQPRPETLPTIDGFLVMNELGRGGMGVVYLAKQLNLHRTVAIKMLLSGEFASRRERERFQREAEAVAQLQHPNIVQLFSIGEQSGCPFLCMEWIDGPDLSQALARRSIPTDAAAELVDRLAGAVHLAHQMGIIHRDLKPSNVLLRQLTATNELDVADERYWKNVEPKITDFGLAKRSSDVTATRTGATLGTPGYMPPEQALGSGEPLGPQADVFALGAILYECLTGRPPFRAATAVEIVRQVLHEEPISPTQLHPGLDRDLETICLKCLQKDPKRRYGSAKDLADDLQRYRRGEIILARPITSWERGWKWVKRRPAVAAAWGVTCLATVALTWILAYSNLQLQRERNIAERHFDAALEAVDRNFTFVSEDLLLNAPHMQPVRRRLLETSRDFYERFVRERAHDSRLRAELARAYARLGKITSEISSHVEARDEYRRAIAIIEPLVAQHPEDPSLRQTLATAWMQLGNVLGALREIEPAEQALQSAIRIGDESEAKEAASHVHSHFRGQSRHGLAEIYRIAGRLDDADRLFRTALTAHQAAVHAAPNNPHYQRDLAHTHHNLAVVAMAKGQTEEAEKEYQHALAVHEGLVEANPSIPQFRTALAATLNNLGGLYYEQEQYDRSEAIWKRVVEIQEDLAQTFPDVVQNQIELAEARTNLASLQLTLGHLDLAEQGYLAALSVRQQLVARFPDEPEYRAGLALTHNNLGVVYANLDRTAEALAAFTASAEIRKSLTRDYPPVSQYRFDLGRNYVNLGGLEHQSVRYEAALKWYDEAERTLEELLQAEPGNALARAALVQGIGGRAESKTLLGRADAIDDWDRAVQMESGPRQSGWQARRAWARGRLGQHARAVQEADALLQSPDLSAESRFDLACAYSLSARAAACDQQLTPQDQATQANAYAVRAVNLLTELSGQGYFSEPEAWGRIGTDADLDPIRANADFQAWLASLPAPQPEN